MDQERALHLQNDMTLAAFIAELWAVRWYMLVTTLLSLGFGIVFLSLATPQYKSQMIISAANPMNGAESSSLLADDNLFALRYLVQRVGVQNSSDFTRFETTYKGVQVAKRLMIDPIIVKGVEKALEHKLLPGKNKINSPEQLSEYIADNVTINSVAGSGAKAMTYWHPDAAFAKYMIAQIHLTTDQLIRSKIKTNTGNRISYLKNAILETRNPEHRRALTTLLMEQERLHMLVTIETPYAAAVIEPPMVSSRPLWPSKSFSLFAFGFVGLIAGFVLGSIALTDTRAHGPHSKRTEENPDKPFKQRSWFRMSHKNSNDPDLPRRPITEGRHKSQKKSG